MLTESADLDDIASRHASFWADVAMGSSMTEFPTATPDEIGARLRFLVEYVGKSQAAVAADAGVSKQRLNNAISGLNRISLDDAIRLSRRYHVTLDWIYLGRRDFLPHEFQLALDARDRDANA